MTQRARGTTGPDRGSAPVEFVTVGVLLLVPVVYLVLTLGRLQSAAFATEAAARGALRAVTSAETEADGLAAARLLVGYALADQGFDADPDAATTVRCPPAGCLEPGGTVSVTVEVVVSLPGTGDLLLGGPSTGVPVSSTHVGAVDEFRGRPPAEPE